MKKLLYMMLASLLLALQSCVDDDYKHIWIDNRSPHDVSVYVATGFYGFGPTAYPDTLLPQNYDLSEYGWKGKLEDWLKDYPVASFTKESVTPSMSCDDNGVVTPRPPRDTLSIFIIDHDTLMKYGYDYVRQHNMILARYDVHWRNAWSMDYTFVYPSENQSLKPQ
jgi:hypothetical protein